MGGYDLLAPADGDEERQAYWARRGDGAAALLWHLTARAAGREGAAERFERAAVCGRRLDHPYLVRVLDHGRDAGVPWMAEEVVDAVDLAQMLAALREIEHRMPTGVALDVAERVAAALAHVHAATDDHGRPLMLAHQGVAARHVLITRDGEARLTGLHRPVAAYAPPEARAGGPRDARGDLFALGVLLAEMLLGARPDTDHPDPDWAGAVTLACQAARPELPERVAALVRELCAANPEDRPAGARMAAHRLGRLLEALPGHAGLAPYVIPGVNHLAPPGGEHWPSRLLAARADPEPPSGPPPDDDGPRLSLPRPPEAAPTPSAPTPSLAPQLLAFERGPAKGEARRARGWKDAGATGLPAWVMILMAVLSVVGAVAVTRLLIGAEDGAPAAAVTDAPRRARATQGGVLEVTSDPPGARVYVDGEPTHQETPATLDGLRINLRLRVSVDRDGYVAPPAEEVIIPISSQRALHFRLDRLYRHRIVTDPPGAEVSVDGRKAREVAPVDLAPRPAGRRVHVEAFRRGFVPAEATVKVGVSSATVTLSLTPARLFTVTSNPSDAMVRVDGVEVGRTPLEEHPVVQGRRFVLEVERPGARPFRQALTARGPLVREVHAKLPLLPLAELDLDPSERALLDEIQAQRRDVEKRLRAARAAMRRAEKAVLRFRHASQLDLDQLEAARARFDEAEAEVDALGGERSATDRRLEELRRLAVERLEREARL